MEPYNPLRYVHELRLKLSTRHTFARSQAAASCNVTEVLSRSQLAESPRAQSPCRADSASEMNKPPQKEASSAVRNQLDPSSSGATGSSSSMRADTAEAPQFTMCPNDEMEALQYVPNFTADEQQLIAPQPDSNSASVANGAAHATEDRQLLAPQLTSEDIIMTTAAAGTAADNQQVLSQLDSKSCCNMVTSALGAPAQLPEAGAYSTHAALPRALPLAGRGFRRMRLLARWAALSAGVAVGAPVAWASGVVAGAVQGSCCAGLGLVGGLQLAVPAAELLCKVRRLCLTLMQWCLCLH